MATITQIIFILHLALNVAFADELSNTTQDEMRAVIRALGTESPLISRSYDFEVNSCSAIPNVVSGFKCELFEKILLQKYDTKISDWIVGKSSAKMCGFQLEHANFVSSEITLDELENHNREFMVNLKGSFNIPMQCIQAGIRAFQKKLPAKNKSEINNEAFLTHLASTEFSFFMKNIENNHEEILKAIEPINQLVDNDKKIVCDNLMSTKLEQTCQKAKLCKSSNDIRENYFNHGAKAIHKYLTLKSQIKPLKRANLNRQRQIKEHNKQIKEKLNVIEQYYPWLNGEVLKGQLGNLNSLVEQDEDVFSDQAKRVIKDQLKYTRDKLRVKHLKYTKMAKCLTGQFDLACNDLKNEIFKLPTTELQMAMKSEKYESKSKSDKKKILLADSYNLATNCIQNQVVIRENMNKTIQTGVGMIGGLALSFAGGPIAVGGMVARTASTLKSFNSIRKAGISIGKISGGVGVLGGELAVSAEMVKNTIQYCREKLGNLDSYTNSKKLSCGSLTLIENSKTKECVKDALLTGVGIGASFIGTLGKNSKASRSHAKDTKALIDEQRQVIATLFNKIELPEVLQKPLLKQLENGNIELKDFKKFAELYGGEIKSATSLNRVMDELVGLRHLSRKQRNAAINSLVKKLNKPNLGVKSEIMSLSKIPTSEQPKTIKGFLGRIKDGSEHTTDYIAAVRDEILLKMRQQRYERIYNKELTRLKKQYPNSSEQAIEAIAKETAIGRRLKGQEIANSCKSSKLNMNKAKAGALYSTTMLSLGMSSTGLFFANAHWNEVKDLEWAKKLGYEVFMNYLINKWAAKIAGTPGGGFVDKTKSNYIMAAKIAIIESTAYAAGFDKNKELSEEKILELASREDFKANIEKMEQFLSTRGGFERVVDIGSDALKNIAKAVTGKDTIDEITEQELKKISYEDLQDPLVQARMADIVEDMIYKDSLGGNDTYGNIYLDRMLFDGEWTLHTAPRNVAVAMYTMWLSCRHIDTPAMAAGLILGIQGVNNAANRWWYYNKKKEEINQ